MLSAPFAISAILLAAIPAANGPADRAPDYVPFGVYWSWEYTEPLAKLAGVGKWAFVGKRLDLLRVNGVDSVWVTNFGISDLVPMLKLCAERGLKLFPCFGEIHYDIDWRLNNWKYFDEQIAAVAAQVKAAGPAASALAAYILCDEPRAQVLDGLEELRRRFAAMDPTRPAFAVTMWPTTLPAIEKTRCPVLCTDLYSFFGPGDPNGPHTPDSSRAFYVGNQGKYIGALQGTGRVHWVMFMCFTEVWGPWKYDDRFHMIALPGSYMHWVCPTEAQMRWQVWAGLRCGSKGFFCFTSVAALPDPKTAQAPPPADENLKPVLATQPTDVGPACLINPDSSPTPQLVAMGEAYRQIARHRDLVRRWELGGEPVARVDAPCSLAAFVDPRDKARYLVVTNDDFDAPAHAALTFDAGVHGAEDLVGGKPLKLSAGGKAAVDLQPGGGTILRLP